MIPFDSQREKKRASAAFRLTKWLDEDGNKLPVNESGIALHREAVVFYEGLYGPISAAGQRQYDNLYKSIRKGIEDTEQANTAAAALMQQYQDDREREKAESDHAVVVAMAASRLRQARNAMDRATTRVAILAGRIIPSSEQHQVTLESDLQRLRLLLDRYEAGSRRYDTIAEHIADNERVLANVQDDLVEQQEDLAQQREAIETLTAQVVKYIAILDGDDVDDTVEPEPVIQPPPPIVNLPELAPDSEDNEDDDDEEIPGSVTLHNPRFEARSGGFHHLIGWDGNLSPELQRRGRPQKDCVVLASGNRVKLWGQLSGKTFYIVNSDIRMVSVPVRVREGEYVINLNDSLWSKLANLH